MSGAYILFWFPFEAELIVRMPWCRIPFSFVRIFFFLLELHAGSQEEAKVTPNKSYTKKLSSFCSF
jgi:hypothetical protein